MQQQFYCNNSNNNHSVLTVMLRTPLHCAASCNNVDITQLLVLHGACAFVTALSDNEKPSEKCEPDEDNYDSCLQFLQGEMSVVSVIICIGMYKSCFIITQLYSIITAALFLSFCNSLLIMTHKNCFHDDNDA